MTSATVRLVLLPGLDGTGRLFAPFREHLPTWLKPEVVSYDPAAPRGYDELFVELESRLSDGERFHLLAESFSGPLALRYAAAHPGRVRGLVLCATFARPPRPAWLLRRVPAVLFRLRPPGALVRRYLVRGGASPELVAEFQRAVGAVSPEVLAFRVRQLAGVEVTAPVQARALYLQAEQDRLVPGSSLDGLGTVLPDLKVVALPGPHLLLQARAEAAAGLVAEFLMTLNSRE